MPAHVPRWATPAMCHMPEPIVLVRATMPRPCAHPQPFKLINQRQQKYQHQYSSEKQPNSLVDVVGDVVEKSWLMPSRDDLQGWEESCRVLTGTVSVRNVPIFGPSLLRQRHAANVPIFGPSLLRQRHAAASTSMDCIRLQGQLADQGFCELCLLVLVFSLPSRDRPTTPYKGGDLRLYMVTRVGTCHGILLGLSVVSMMSWLMTPISQL
jgi:hypothetical protein